MDSPCAAGLRWFEIRRQKVSVARAVAGGATNREAAALLFVTTRTVEVHLTNVYRKLGIRSRTELAAKMAADAPQPGPAA